MYGSRDHDTYTITQLSGCNGHPIRGKCGGVKSYPLPTCIRITAAAVLCMWNALAAYFQCPDGDDKDEGQST